MANLEPARGEPYQCPWTLQQLTDYASVLLQNRDMPVTTAEALAEAFILAIKTAKEFSDYSRIEVHLNSCVIFQQAVNLFIDIYKRWHERIPSDIQSLTNVNQKLKNFKLEYDKLNTT